jgi:hypothetical protein
MLDTPVPIEEAMAEFEAHGPEADQRCDPRLLGSWVNRVGYVGTTSFVLSFHQKGIYNGSNHRGEYLTMYCEGVNWLYQVNRSGSSVGRSLRIYVIDGDQLFMRFQRPDARWQLWEREPKSSG